MQGSVKECLSRKGSPDVVQGRVTWSPRMDPPGISVVGFSPKAADPYEISRRVCGCSSSYTRSVDGEVRPHTFQEISSSYTQWVDEEEGNRLEGRTVSSRI